MFEKLIGEIVDMRKPNDMKLANFVIGEKVLNVLNTERHIFVNTIRNSINTLIPIMKQRPF